MSDRDGMNPPGTCSTLASALRTLPPAAPRPDLWPDLSHALAARQRTARMRAWGLAVAAAAALLALVPLLPANRHGTPATPSAAPVATTATPTAADGAARELAALHQRSQALERWIAGATQAPVDGRDLMAAVEVEDMIGLVDLQLEAARGNADALPLWRQRVGLLEDLATIRTSPYALAAN